MRSALVVLCIGLSACGSKGDTEQAPAAWHPPSHTERPTIPAISFEAIELPFTHHTGGTDQRWLPEPMGPGVALFDFDQDHDLDIFFVDGGPLGPDSPGVRRSVLLRNDGQLNFVDVTEQAGIRLDGYGQGACAGDLDGDGDPDLVVTAVEGQRVFRNDKGRFSDITKGSGLQARTWTDVRGKEHPEWSTGCVFVDVDGDDWLDLFVGNYVQWSIENDLFTTIDGETKSFTTPTRYPGLSSRLFRNTGKGYYEDVTVESGVWNPDGKALGVAVVDLNDDGRMDIVVANDTQPNNLFVNQGDGLFVDTAQAAGVAYDEHGRARSGMGVDVVDLQGSTAIAIGNFSREPVSLYVSGGGGVYTDQSGRRRLSGPTLLPLTFGVRFFDADRDGRQDLFLANGHLEPEIERIEENITYAQALQLFWNDGQQFVEVGAEAGEVFTRNLVARAVASGDLDNDGDDDLVVGLNGGQALLLRNDSVAAHHWLQVRLEQDGPNKAAIGARVSVTAGTQTQQFWVRTGSSYLAQSALLPTIGLGEATVIDKIVVRWPDGTEGIEQNIPVDTVQIIRRK